MRSSREGSSSSGRGAPIASGSKYRRGAFMRPVLSWESMGPGLGRFRFRRNSPDERSLNMRQARFRRSDVPRFHRLTVPGPATRKRYFPNSKSRRGRHGSQQTAPERRGVAKPSRRSFGARFKPFGSKNPRNTGPFASLIATERQVRHLRRRSCNERVA
jgi:hypothetical protein